MDTAAGLFSPRLAGGTCLITLSLRHYDALLGFASSNVLIAFDYDGTLAPIAKTPQRAQMRAFTRHLLAKTASLYPCVVISGRSLADLAGRLEGVPVWYIFGNHGFEPLADHERHAARVRDWVKQLKTLLPRTPGLVVEEKRYSATIHYRRARNKRRVLRIVEDAVSQLPDVRAIGGSEAINLLPSGGPDKGVALQQARKLFACDTAIYVGDDQTDEDAFGSAPPDRLLGIRVGRTRRSLARYCLRDQKDVDELLETLIALRTPLVQRRHHL